MRQPRASRRSSRSAHRDSRTTSRAEIPQEEAMSATAESDDTGTTAVPERLRVDVESLSRWLAANVEGFAGPLEIELFRGGQSNPTYLLTTPGARYVMRSKPAPSARLLPSAHAIEREFRVLEALAQTTLPVPRVHAL